MTLNKTVRPLLTLGALAAMSTGAQAALSITNGDFQDPALADGGIEFAVTDWFESNTDASNFNEFTYFNSAHFAAEHTSGMLGLGGGNSGDRAGYVYQAIGTRAAGDNFVTINADYFKRHHPSTGQSRMFGTMDFEFFSGNFTGADGTAITGLNSLGSIEVTALELGFDDTDVNLAEYANYTSEAVSLAGANVGDTIWIKVDSSTAGLVSGPLQYNPWVDNMSVATSAAAVPEPSSAALLGLGGLALILRRRK